MGEAALKERKPDLVKQASSQLYGEQSGSLVPNAKRILRQNGRVLIHAEPIGTKAIDGSVIEVKCERDLDPAIQEAFVNARGLVVDRQDPYVWLS